MRTSGEDRIGRPILSLTMCLAAIVAGCGGEVPEAGSNADGGSGSGSSANKRIVILTNGDNPFWDPCEAGAMEAATELKLEEAGFTVSFERANFTVKGQVDKLKQYGLATDIVGIGISVYDDSSPAIANELKKLQEAGIKIVTIDGDIDRERFRDVRFAYLGTDNVIGGRELGRAAADLRPEGGKYATFVGNKGNSNARARISGFAEGAGDKFDEVESLDDGGKPEVARKMVRDALDRHPEIDTLVGIWAYNGPAAIQIVTERKLRDKTSILTFDADEASIKGMGEGNLDAMVVQNPFNMGYQGVRILKALVEDDQEVIKEMYPNHGEPDGDLFRTGLKVVIPNEGSPLQKDAFDSQTEFLKLDEFKAWLKKYNLKSS
ncbi:MAG: substrate-binding domain-containing protein [Planctomycetaceae bacterium]|jgi:ribose transport system substrate-binding protein|nr:substrate-binding domain-containing protein [Planctomycetaceae bacterium]MBT6487116.1 substrate-binding domain-containing protein [Planctomycetaceae bacterium]MBT6496948.1 substrate-binding domain-containing protein [Planctomycetaceae bacterium]